MSEEKTPFETSMSQLAGKTIKNIGGGELSINARDPGLITIESGVASITFPNRSSSDRNISIRHLEGKGFEVNGAWIPPGSMWVNGSIIGPGDIEGVPV